MIIIVIVGFPVKLTTRRLSEWHVILAKHQADLLLSRILTPRVAALMSYLQALDIMNMKSFTVSYLMG